MRLQGELEVVKEFTKRSVIKEEEEGGGEEAGDKTKKGKKRKGGGEAEEVVVVKTEVSRMPFLMLGLDLPPPPLFKDVMEKNIIPQVQYLSPSSTLKLRGYTRRTTTEQCSLSTPHLVLQRCRGE